MSTLRISNIEAKSVPASATIDEKVKITNSSGDPLVFIDGKTSGITTVGINTTDPNITFDANSNVVVTGVITATKFSGQFEPTSVGIADSIFHTGDTNTAIRFPAADTITAETGGSERLRITSGGQVRIANTDLTTSSSADDLIVGTTSSNRGITIFSGTSNTGNIYFADTDTSGTGNRMGTISYYHDGNYMRFSTNGNQERLRITSAGSIGINSTSPDRRFTLYQDATTRMNLKSLANSTTGIEFGDPADHNIGYIVYDNTDDSMQFGVNAGERLRIASTGNVSINTTNVTEGVLQVNGDITAKKLHGGRMYGVLAGRNFDGNNALGGYALEYGSGYESPYIVAYNNTGSPSINNITFGSLTTSDRNLNTGLTKLVEINANSGNMSLNTGNLVIGTSGKGIDFSATGDATGNSSELLDDYEEGSWTPAAKNAGSFTSPTGRYVKIGHQVTVWAYIPTITDITSTSNFEISGLPYTATSSNHTEFVGPVMMRFQSVTDQNGATFTTYQASGWNYLRIYASRDDGNNYEAAKHSEWNFTSAGIRFCHSYTV